MKKSAFKPKTPFKELVICLDIGQPTKVDTQLIYPATLIVYFDDGKNISLIKGKEVADVKVDGTSIINKIVPTGQLITNSLGEVYFDISIPTSGSHLIQVGIQWGKMIKWATERIEVNPTSSTSNKPKYLLIDNSEDKEVYLNKLDGNGYFKPVGIDIGKKAKVVFRSDGNFKVKQGKQKTSLYAKAHNVTIDKVDDVRIKTSKDWQEIKVVAGKFTKTIICLK